jgi:hypothetical protein
MAGIHMADEAPPDVLYPHWQYEYEAAIIEPNGELLQQRIDTAESAIERRLQELAQDSNHHTERHVISDALRSLRQLRNSLPPTKWFAASVQLAELILRKIDSVFGK